MKANEFTAAVDKLRGLLTTQLPAINEQMALDATAMIKDRIINTGKDAQGAELGTYSTNELPAFFFKDKALNQGGQKLYDDAVKKKERDAHIISTIADGGKVKKNKRLDSKKRTINYKEWREANNRPTDHVSLSFSGTTLKDTGPVKQVINGTKITTKVGAKNTKVRSDGANTEKVLDEYLGPRYGNFLQPNAVEAEKLKKFLEKKVAALIHESFR